MSKGITQIENYAFSDCSDLTKITFSESLISIENDAFENCSSLTYQGSPPLLSCKGESGGFGDFLVSGGVQAPSDKLR